MDLKLTGWFSEISDLWPGQCFSLQIKKVLYESKSKFQDILIFESTEYGRVLVLDGAIQLTERDEPGYQEMITFLPLSVHPNPKNVLIIGGGDGGVAREACKLSTVETIDLVEIDEEIVEASKKYLPFTACGYDDPRVTLHIDDGVEFLKKHDVKYDVIITDSTDPHGPGAVLFQEKYFQLIYAALRDDGIMCSQGECLAIDMPVIKEMIKSCSKVFPRVSYATSHVPTYPTGQIGFVLASKNKEINFKTPLRDPPKGLSHYNRDLHEAAFALPERFRNFVTRCS